MKKTIILFMILIFIAGFIGCDGSHSADRVMGQQSEQAMQEANAQIGMPAIVNFQERKLAKMIFELRDKADLITFAYIININGDLIFLGQCIGFGLPYSVQYTSPLKMVDRYGDPVDSAHEPHIMPQADPNGLFMPEGLSATWLMMINPETGEAEPIYVEPKILVSPFPLHKN